MTKSRAAIVCQGAFALQFVVLDLFRRDALQTLKEQPRRALALLLSVVLGAWLWQMARSKAARGALALSTGALLALQIMATRYFGTSIDVHFILSAKNAWKDVYPALAPQLVPLSIMTVVVWLAEAICQWPERAAPGQRFTVSLGAAFLLAAVAGPSFDQATPELRFVAGLRAFAIDGGRVAAEVSVEPVRSTRRQLPSVLFILTESVRASDYPSAPLATSDLNPEVNRLLPNRIPLPALRAISSYTAVAVNGLATGRSQLGTREEIAAFPTFYDFLGAIEAPQRVHRSYISGHTDESIWARLNLEEAVDTYLARDLLDEDKSIDTQVVTSFIAQLERKTAPDFYLLHLYGTHAPYHVETSPFQPQTKTVSWNQLDALHNRYKNAIVTQDVEIARAVQAFIASRAGPWVIVFTSDHGEAFGEHQAIHHGQSLYDEQIHVPGFIAHGGGALIPEEEAVLRARAAGATSHLDLLPTLLDLYGIWDDFSLLPQRSRMLGTSLLSHAPRRPARAIPITSCNASMTCPINTWGMLGERHALIAQSWDFTFLCVPLDDSSQAIDETPECASLRADSKRHFALLPNGRANH